MIMYENIVVTTLFYHKTRLFGIYGQLSKLFEVPAFGCHHTEPTADAARSRQAYVEQRNYAKNKGFLPLDVRVTVQ